MKKQSGLSLGGFIVVCFVVIFVALLGFKLFTPYTQYLTIQKTFRDIANDPEMKGASVRDIKMAYVKHSMIDNIDSVGPDDIDIEKDGDNITLSAAYSVKVPLVANVSLLIDFNATSNK
ncbi:MAG TPA: DUF4845 domain-containing protein [Burkholderiales bacterium]|nr:DUF4845 domain-containing protein [Burkholderiales bacterium]